MILDRLENSGFYRGLDLRVTDALNYLAKTDFSRMPQGRHSLDGEELFALVQRYATKPVRDAKWEAHRRYVDVQYVVQGAEQMGYAPLDSRLTIRQPYDADKDIVFFDAQGGLFEVRAGMFVLFGPQDIHAPGLACSFGMPAEVLKVVVKCRL
ncbi:MAG: YhcH/YjgK/YiaL family protein [Thermoguttaceae bacterium]